MLGFVFLLFRQKRAKDPEAHSHPNKCSDVQSLELDTSGIGRRESKMQP